MSNFQRLKKPVKTHYQIQNTEKLLQLFVILWKVDKKRRIDRSVMLSNGY